LIWRRLFPESRRWFFSSSLAFFCCLRVCGSVHRAVVADLIGLDHVGEFGRQDQPAGMLGGRGGF
jgi:hypothetical protein